MIPRISFDGAQILP